MIVSNEEVPAEIIEKSHREVAEFIGISYEDIVKHNSTLHRLLLEGKVKDTHSGQLAMAFYKELGKDDSAIRLLCMIVASHLMQELMKIEKRKFLEAMAESLSSGSDVSDDTASSNEEPVGGVH